jgi:hypothetical protein
LKIAGAISIESCDLKEKNEPEHLSVQYAADGAIEGMCWKYNTTDASLHSMVKRRGAEWNRSARLWVFPDQERANGMIQVVRRRHPEWPMISNDKAAQDSAKPLAATSFSRLDLPGGTAAIVLPFPLPYFTETATLTAQSQHFVKVNTKGDKALAILVVGSAEGLGRVAEDLQRQGAKRDKNDLARRFELTSVAKIQVKVSGWAVHIVCDLGNPLHYVIRPQQKYQWTGIWPNGVKAAIPWDGRTHITQKLWPALKRRIEEAGLPCEGDNPDAEITSSTVFDPSLVPGWNEPAANGFLLHDYQKEGALFCASRGMRALIGDEMGVGKTAQAIAAANTRYRCWPRADYLPCQRSIRMGEGNKGLGKRRRNPARPRSTRYFGP